MRVLVTGGSRGIGLALCRRFLEMGCEVVTLARSPSGEVHSLRSKYGRSFVFLEMDLGKGDLVGRFNKADELLRAFDVVVFNAAIERSELLANTSERQLRDCIEVNLISTIQVSQCCLRRCLAEGVASSFVYISSVAAFRGLRGLGVYGATKAALSAFARGLAVEYGERNIRANVVVPGYVDGGMATQLPPEVRHRVVRRTPTNRVASIRDVVGVVAFLAGKESGHINGEELRVDGGYLIS